MEPGSPALGARSLSRWTTREVPLTFNSGRKPPGHTRWVPESVFLFVFPGEGLSCLQTNGEFGQGLGALLYSLVRFVCVESVMPSNHLILCRPLLLPPSIFPSIRVSSSESVLRIRWPKDWSFSFIRHYLQYPKLGGNPSAHQQTFGLKICGPCTQQNITQP